MHWPVEQTLPPLHALPHAPQLSGSTSMRTQTPLHDDSPGPHWQAPSTQRVPPVQTTEHAPQFLRSVKTSTHEPAHALSPESQAPRHAPPLQTDPPEHALPQSPQF